MPVSCSLRFAPVLLGLALAACASTPIASSTTSALTPGAQASIEGRIARVDTAPWAYDGNAHVIVDTAAHGAVALALPARWNLCKAGGGDTVASLEAGNRVRAVGTVSDEGEVVVCERPTHRIERVAP